MPSLTRTSLLELCAPGKLTRMGCAGRQIGQQVDVQAPRDAAGQQRQGGRHALARGQHVAQQQRAHPGVHPLHRLLLEAAHAR